MTPLDVVIVVILVAALAAGLRRGLLATLGALVGLVVGGVVAFLAVPLLVDLLPVSQWRGPLTVVLAVVLPLVGASIGSSLGHGVRAQVDRTALRPVDRVLGGFAGVVVALLSVSFVASTVKAAGLPVLSPAISSSVVLRTIEEHTPAPLARTMAQARAAVLDDGLPRIDALLDPRRTTTAPQVDLADPALESAAQSVARVWGTAYECATTSTGSGFVATPDRVVTNAHVVAGVDRPIVELPGRPAQEGRVVHYDTEADLAVVAVDDLDGDPLLLAPTLTTGDPAVVQGYPYGGPLTSVGAQVLDVGRVSTTSSDGSGQADRDVYALAAEVHAGNSGGPVLTVDGEVAGVVFARSESDDDLAYGVTTTELAPVVAQAPDLVDAVTPGRCTG